MTFPGLNPHPSSIPGLQALRVILISNLAARPTSAARAPAIANTAALAVLSHRAAGGGSGLAARGRGAGLGGGDGCGLEGGGVGGRGTTAATAVAGAGAGELGGAGDGVAVEV